jgi:hypothetical protein
MKQLRQLCLTDVLVNLIRRRIERYYIVVLMINF